ncbi:hypothetical protein FKG94_23720 [Exilibacterium tricleocarpae]|uniref:Uncharacterized protein n=1 Tax=Exilibacterium tricleocarpae TaxID=2591008 RepID=A0A545STM6_9GAMM|nr:hypothetical protein [Exilibacterium tricleocarpae]TQV68300.1 hypothetical protein FKG94_23720 [Exilibacterium tricleocarpae]
MNEGRLGFFTQTSTLVVFSLFAVFIIALMYWLLTFSSQPEDLENRKILPITSAPKTSETSSLEKPVPKRSTPSYRESSVIGSYSKDYQQ